MRATDTTHGGPVPREDIAAIWALVGVKRMEAGETERGMTAMRAARLYRREVPGSSGPKKTLL